MEKYRDLFTEKNISQLSLYHSDMLKKYNKKSNKHLYNIISSPVKNYDEEYLTILKNRLFFSMTLLNVAL